MDAVLLRCALFMAHIPVRHPSVVQNDYPYRFVAASPI